MIRSESIKVFTFVFCFLLALPALWAQAHSEAEDSKEKAVSDSISKGNEDQLAFIFDNPKFELALPLWVPGFTGSFAYAGIALYPENAEEGFDDRLSSDGLGVEFYLIAKARYQPGRFFVEVDGFKATLASDLRFTIINTERSIQGTIDGTILRGAAGYRIASFKNLEKKTRLDIEIYGGFRYYDVHVFTEFRSLLDVNPRWTEPVLGLSVPMAWRRWGLRTRVDHGGFGWENYRSWFASADLSYRFSRLFSLGLGWIYQDFDYAREFEFKDLFLEVSLTGPSLHIDFRF